MFRELYELWPYFLTMFIISLIAGILLALLPNKHRADPEGQITLCTVTSNVYCVQVQQSATSTVITVQPACPVGVPSDSRITFQQPNLTFYLCSFCSPCFSNAELQLPRLDEVSWKQLFDISFLK